MMTMEFAAGSSPRRLKKQTCVATQVERDLRARWVGLGWVGLRAQRGKTRPEVGFHRQLGHDI